METQAEIHFCIDGLAGPYLIVEPRLIALVEQWLIDHGVPVQSDEGVIGLDGREAADLINFGVVTQPSQVLTQVRRMALDNGWTLREPGLDEMLAIFEPPVRRNDHGVGTVGVSRVTLASVVAAFKSGRTPEQIVQSFPTLSLAAVYGALAFYIERTEQVDAALVSLEAVADRAGRSDRANGANARLRAAWSARQEGDRAPRAV